MDYNKLDEVIKSLKFPNWRGVEKGYKKPVFGIDRGYVYERVNELEDLFGGNLEGICLHSKRVALKAVRVVDYLKIGKSEVSPRGNARQAMFLVGIAHDIGKTGGEIIKVAEKSEHIAKNGGDFTKEDREKIKEHYEFPVMLEGDSFIKGMLIRIHTYQKDPYPKIPLFFYNSEKFGERNPEVIYLSKLFALVDAHDASLTRKVGDNGNQRNLTNEESKISLLKSFGDLDLSYRGNKLPKIKQSGRDFMLKLYQEGVFGIP